MAGGRRGGVRGVGKGWRGRAALVQRAAEGAECLGQRRQRRQRQLLRWHMGAQSARAAPAAVDPPRLPRGISREECAQRREALVHLVDPPAVVLHR